MTTATQPELLPASPPQYTNTTIDVRDLPESRLLEGPDPDRDLIESVRAFGIIDPLTIVPVDTDNHAAGWVILDGGRRIKAVRQLLNEWWETNKPTEDGQPLPPSHLHILPARIPAVTEGDVSDVLALQKHSTRKRNPISEYQRVKRLLHGGHDLKSVVKRTGLTTNEIQRLLRLDALPIALLEGASEGRVSMGQAYQIVALPAAARERLEQAFIDGGRKGIKTSEIAAQRQARVTSATTAMDWGQIDSVPASTSLPGASAASDEDSARTARALQLGLSVLDALQGIDNGALSVSLDVDGKFTVTVTPGSLGETAHKGNVTITHSPFHVEREMMAADGDTQAIGCPECPAMPGEPCQDKTPWYDRTIVGSEGGLHFNMGMGDMSVATGTSGTTTVTPDLNRPVPLVVALQREAEASVRLDGETQVYDPVVRVPDGDLRLRNRLCEHGASKETCELMPCKRKRQQRDYARRHRAGDK